jgi:hypothetical protein
MAVACAAALDAVDSAAFGDLREKKKKTPKSTKGNTTSSSTNERIQLVSHAGITIKVIWYDLSFIFFFFFFFLFAY